MMVVRNFDIFDNHFEVILFGVVFCIHSIIEDMHDACEKG